jgi:hypothetical protein
MRAKGASDLAWRISRAYRGFSAKDRRTGPTLHLPTQPHQFARATVRQAINVPRLHCRGVAPAGASRRVDDFAGFAEPGWVKIAFDLTAAPAGYGTLLATETRIAATSDDARRAFGRYWSVVRPGSDLVRASWLRAAQRRVTVGA